MNTNAGERLRSNSERASTPRFSSFVPESGGVGFIVEYSSDNNSDAQNSGVGGGSGVGKGLEIIGRLYCGDESKAVHPIPLGELESLVSSLNVIGKPVLLEHGNGEFQQPIGYIAQNWIVDNWLWLKIHVHPEQRLGAKLFNEVRDGILGRKYKQLSIGWSGNIDRQTGAVTSRVFHEASLVEKGKYNRTDIFSVQASNKFEESAIVQQRETIVGNIFHVLSPQQQATETMSVNNPNEPQMSEATKQIFNAFVPPNNQMLPGNVTSSQAAQAMLAQQQQQQQQQASPQQGPTKYTKNSAEAFFGVPIAQEYIDKVGGDPMMVTMEANRVLRELQQRSEAKTKLHTDELESLRKERDAERIEKEKLLQARQKQMQNYMESQKTKIADAVKSLTPFIPADAQPQVNQMIETAGSNPTPEQYRNWVVWSALADHTKATLQELEKYKVTAGELERKLKDQQVMHEVASSKMREQRVTTGLQNAQSGAGAGNVKVPVIETASANGAMMMTTQQQHQQQQQATATSNSTFTDKFEPIVAPNGLFFGDQYDAVTNQIYDQASATFRVPKVAIADGFEGMEAGWIANMTSKDFQQSWAAAFSGGWTVENSGIARLAQ